MEPCYLIASWNFHTSVNYQTQTPGFLLSQIQIWFCSCSTPLEYFGFYLSLIKHRGRGLRSGASTEGSKSKMRRSIYLFGQWMSEVKSVCLVCVCLLSWFCFTWGTPIFIGERNTVIVGTPVLVRTLLQGQCFVFWVRISVRVTFEEG